MQTEIISIGDELLIGQVINTNASYIAQSLNSIGIDVYQVRIVSDNHIHIIEALEDAAKNVEVIILTGGLGPTNDDITKLTLCRYFNTRLEINDEAYQDIFDLFNKRNLKVTELNRLQAELPIDCISIKNINGTARGMWFEKNNKIYISLPGVPHEMKPMIDDYVIPELKKRYCEDIIIHRTILTQGIGESFLAELIKEWESNLPENIKLAYLPSPGIVRLRLTIKGNLKDELEIQLNTQISSLNMIIKNFIYGYDNDNFEELIGALLIKNNQTLSIAESCTGGYISHRITSIAGSSKYFRGSIVAYSNEIKQQILRISNNNLEQNGAVSEEVVKEMAENVMKQFDTNFSIAVSGIAGPGGYTAEKPVGSVWIAIATPINVIAKKYLFGDNRERNIQKAAIAAMNMLRKEILNYNNS